MRAVDTSIQTWKRAIDHARLAERGRAVVKLDGRQLALFAVGDRIYACNNRCPHQGYPLVEGSISKDASRCLLTCQWHNWQFDLDNGANRYRGDVLRVYPTRVIDGAVWVDVSDPPAAERIERARHALREAFDDNETDRIARELARLRKFGADPARAVADAINWTHERFEDGFTHAYAAAAEWLRWYDERPGDADLQLTALLEAIGHLAYDSLRAPRYPDTEKTSEYSEKRFLAAIEAQDEDRAIALARGALAGDLRFADLQRVLATAALSHYTGFGHGLIYVLHAGQLIDRLGTDVETTLLLGLVRFLTRARREDLVPEFRPYAAALAAWPTSPAGGTAPAPEHFAGQSIKAALTAVVDAVHASSNESLFHSLLGAAALQLARFDERWGRSDSENPAHDVDWLDLTHAVTFAHAARVLCSKWPQLWPQALLQIALFLGRNTEYTDAALPIAASTDDAFERLGDEFIADHGVGLYIFSAHRLKTWRAAREELAAGLPDDIAALLRAGVARFVAAPLRERHVRRTVRQARSFVALED